MSLKFEIPRPAIGVKHPDYGFGRPPTPDMLSPAFGAYPEFYRRSKLIPKMAKPLGYHTARLPLVSQRYEKLRYFSDFFVESDYADIMTLCDMGDRSSTHSQLDEGRLVGSGFKIKFRPNLVQKVIDLWQPYVNKVMKTKVPVQVPSNTNLGWPYLFQDNDDKVRAYVLACIAAAVHRNKEQDMSLRDFHAIQERTYGSRFMVPGTRQQHTSKPIPVLYDGGSFTWSQNYESRTRLIVQGGKGGMFWNKLVAKAIVLAGLEIPAHSQDRPYLERTITEWSKKPGFQTVAVDISGFDGNVGQDNLVEVLRWIAKLTGSSHDDLVNEVEAPILMPFMGRPYFTTTRIAPQLPSGVSYTTSVALLISDYVAMLFAELAGLKDGVDFFKVGWGDDIVYCLKQGVDIDKVFAQMTEETGFKFSFEPTIKYLGFNYADGLYKTRPGYSVGRMLVKQIAPERKKFYPYAFIGYASRLLFIPGDKEKFHELALKHLWDESLFGKPCKYSEIKDRLAIALKDVAKAKIVDTDEIYFLTHGFDGDTISDSIADDLDIDFDFKEWIGNAFIDLTDPEMAMKKHSPDVYEANRTYAKKAFTIGVEALPEIVRRLTETYKWRMVGSFGPVV